MMNGIELIAAERKRQIEKKGWTLDHDRQHLDMSLVTAAICYANTSFELHLQPGAPEGWPASWSLNGWKPSNDPIQNLVKAGALLAAEIDRLKYYSDRRKSELRKSVKIPVFKMSERHDAEHLMNAFKMCPHCMRLCASKASLRSHVAACPALREVVELRRIHGFQG
jgi:hypothetical protein